MKAVVGIPQFGAILAILLGSSNSASSQVTITEINPNQSTLQAIDPDGASGGRVNHIASVPGNNQTFYATSEWGGLYKSTDGGHAWSRLNSHLPTVTWDVKVDPNQPNRVYATSFYDGRVNSLAGINISTDGGDTWSHSASAAPPVAFCLDPSRRDEPSAFGIAVDPDNSYAYVGTNCGLAVSSDGGVTWNYIDPTPADPADNVWDVIVHHGGIIDTCGDDGHRRSTDGGNTWTGPTGTPLPSGRCSLAVSPDESYVLFAVVGISIFESNDGGASWSTNFVNPSPQGRIPFVRTNRRTGNNFDLWFGDIRLWRANCTTPVPPTGAGPRCPTSNTWAGPFTRSVGGHDDTGDIVFDTHASADACPVLFSSDGGVYYNTLNTSPGCQSPVWTQPNVTPHGLWLFSMAGAYETATTNRDLYFVSQDDGSFATTNSLLSRPVWNNVDCCDSFDVSTDASRVLYSSCCWLPPGPANRLFLRNPGMTGGGFVTNYPPGTLAGWEYPDILDHFGPGEYVVITSNGVYITTNIAANPIVWTQLGVATTPFAACAVGAAGPTNNPTFYVLAGTCSGNQASALWTYTGTSANGAWRQLNPPGGQGGFGIFAVDRNNPNRLFVSYLGPNGPLMMRSNNAGASWTAVPTLDNLMTGSGVFRYQNRRGPTDFTSFGGYVQPTLVAFDPGSDNIVAGGADSGIFLSTDDGASWITLTGNLGTAAQPVIPRPHFAYFDLRVNLLDVYVGTAGHGVWRLTTVLRSIMPQVIKFELSNEVPVTQRVTLATVTGSQFTPGSMAEIGIHSGTRTAAVVTHGVAPVSSDGSFIWGTKLSPQVACGSEMTAIVNDSVSGLEATATTMVICP